MLRPNAAAALLSMMMGSNTTCIANKGRFKAKA